MAIILFAMIGAIINAPVWYWVAYGVLTTIEVIFAIGKTQGDN